MVAASSAGRRCAAPAVRFIGSGSSASASLFVHQTRPFSLDKNTYSTHSHFIGKHVASVTDAEFATYLDRALGALDTRDYHVARRIRRKYAVRLAALARGATTPGVKPMLKFYFSGLRDTADAATLQPLGVTRVLVDPHDLPNAAAFPHVALDSGAYRAFKAGTSLDLPALLHAATSRAFDMVFADVFGDAEASYQVYQTVKQTLPVTVPVVPVWPWGSDLWRLHRLLDASQIVGIGGLVPHLRRDNPLSDRDTVLAELTALVAEYPGRLHAFGLCWAKALDTLWELLYSADTSHWLAARRSTAMATYVHTGTGYLQEAPWRSLKHPDVESAVTASVGALRDFRPVTWACTRCGAVAPHHQMRLLPAAKRKCACGGKLRGVLPGGA